MKNGTTTIKDRLLFFVKNIIRPKVNASFVSSSVKAAEAMLADIDFNNIDSVIELGPGTGPYTAEILKKCKSTTRVILIEIDTDYIRILHEKFGDRVIIEQIDAKDIELVVAKYGLVKPDLIVSALPFLPNLQKVPLFNAIKKYTEQGTIFRFQIIFQSAGKRIYKSLPIRKLRFVLRNIPPLWIYGVN